LGGRWRIASGATTGTHLAIHGYELLDVRPFEPQINPDAIRRQPPLIGHVGHRARTQLQAPAHVIHIQQPLVRGEFLCRRQGNRAKLSIAGSALSSGFLWCGRGFRSHGAHNAPVPENFRMVTPLNEQGAFHPMFIGAKRALSNGVK
jgi:hypothetical protein